VEEDAVDDVVVGIEVGDGGAGEEAEHKHLVVLGSQRKGVR